jgi:hypothetical protein
MIGALRDDSEREIAEQLDRRRRAAAEHWNLDVEVGLIGAGCRLCRRLAAARAGED